MFNVNLTNNEKVNSSALWCFMRLALMITSRKRDMRITLLDNIFVFDIRSFNRILLHWEIHEIK
jgi:hypothetical protein